MRVHAVAGSLSRQIFAHRHTDPLSRTSSNSYTQQVSDIVLNLIDKDAR